MVCENLYLSLFHPTAPSCRHDYFEWLPGGLAWNAVQQLPLAPVRAQILSRSLLATTFISCCADLELMDPNAPRQNRRDNVLSSLNALIETLNLAKEFSNITPAAAIFGSVSVILATIRVGFFLNYLVSQLQVHKKHKGLDDQRGGLR